MGVRTHISDDLYITPTYSVILPFYDFDDKVNSKAIKIIQEKQVMKRAIPMDYKPPNLVEYEIIKESKNKKNLDEYFMSPGQTKRLKYACSMLQILSKELTATNWQLKKKFTYKLAFITVTLPAVNNTISDKYFKNIYFKRFLEILRDKYKLRHYVWKAEAQKGGNIHFHLIANIYIHYTLLNIIWNNCLNPTGLPAAFYNKWGHNDPNSTDIHSVKKIKHLGSYLIKYMSKKENSRREIEGKIWNCSNSLKYTKRLIISGVETANEYSNYLYGYFFSSIKKTQYCDLLFKNLYLLPHTNCPTFKTELNRHLYELDKMQLQRNAIDQLALIEKLTMIKIKQKLKSKWSILKQRKKEKIWN